MPLIEALRCAKCNTFVRRWETWYDAPTGDHVFRAFCHGEEDECRVNMGDIDPRQVIEVVAFRNLPPMLTIEQPPHYVKIK